MEINSEINFAQFAGHVKENYDGIKIHQDQCTIDTKGKHSFIHSFIHSVIHSLIHSFIQSFINRGNIHLIISMDHSVSIVTVLPSISVKLRLANFIIRGSLVFF